MVQNRISPRALLLVLLLPMLAVAATVTAAQIVAAIQSSSSANAWLKSNAQAVANLAINVESGGETTAYNGSCCYGVLQMNTSNIAKYAGVPASTYRQWSLPQQVDAWSALTADALKSSVVQKLVNLGTFDGRTVDGDLVLSCVQLGIGNCQKMISSGSCSGFADSNGTTICDMANKMAGTSTTSSGSASSGSTGSGGSDTISSGCLGGCTSVTEALKAGFLNGSGVSMSSLKGFILALSAATSVLIIAACLIQLWSRYAEGKMLLPDFKLYGARGGFALVILFLAMSVL